MKLFIDHGPNFLAMESKMLHEKDCESKTIIPRITCLSLSIKLFKIRVLQRSRVAMLKKKKKTK